MTEAGTHSQIDYIISSSTTSHLYQNTEYEEELLSDHKGISVRSPLLFPEFHTQQKNLFLTGELLITGHTNLSLKPNLTLQFHLETGMINP